MKEAQQKHWNKSGADAFGKSSLVLIFFTNLGVTGILCSLKIVLEEKTDK